MLEFGHQCLDDANFHSVIPLILIDAHVALSQREPDPRAYFQQDKVWRDIETVYTTWLAMYPDDTVSKSKYCHFACLSGKWKLAQKLFDQLGTKVDFTPFGSKAEMENLKQQAAEATDPQQ
jgi:hypothetical protein